MNNTITYKGYTAIVGFSAEDECLVGHIAGINDVIGFHADSVEDIRKFFTKLSMITLPHVKKLAVSRTSRIP